VPRLYYIFGAYKGMEGRKIKNENEKIGKFNIK
jgi:hypothetical protein